MNYEDEPYARAYTRDTATWKLMGFPARTVLLHMLRDRFDRSGVFDCEGHDPSQAVAAVTDVPVEIAAEGIARLVELGTWIFSDGRIVWPNYLHAQTCSRSDRLRQAESRKNRRARALNSEPTSPAQVSQGVTECHDSSQESQSVTLSLADLSLAEQSRDPDARAGAPEISPPPSNPKSSAGADLRESGTFEAKPPHAAHIRKFEQSFASGLPDQRADVARVVARFAEFAQLPKVKILNGDVRGAIVADAIATFGEADCLKILDAAKRDDRVNGRGEFSGGEPHWSLEYIFKPTTAERLFKAAVDFEQRRARNRSGERPVERSPPRGERLQASEIQKLASTIGKKAR